MSHPFFDVVEYPWSHRPEADDLYRVLSEAITEPKEIFKLYETHAPEGAPRLFLETGADKIWQQALQDLTKAGRLRDLCYELAANTFYGRNPAFRAAVRAVIEAQRPPSAPPDEGQESPTRPPARLGWRHVLVPAVAALLGLAGGVLGGSCLRVGDPPPLPAVVVHGPNDLALRAGLSDVELTSLEKHVDGQAGTTVLVADIGPWEAAGRVRVRVRPAEYAKDRESVYAKTYTLMKGTSPRAAPPGTWDEHGVFDVPDVQGQPDDHLYVFVVLPVTPSSEKLLADANALKRFLCIKVSP